MILVVGASGQIGRQLVPLLQERGAELRAISRTPSKAAAILPPETEIMKADLADPASLPAVLDGVDCIFLNTNASPRVPVIQGNLLQAAAQAGVKSVVKLSRTVPDLPAPLKMRLWHKEVEELAVALGLETTFLYVTTPMQALLPMATLIAQRGVFRGPTYTGRDAFVDYRDIAPAAAEVLLNPERRGRNYVLTGLQTYTPQEVAALMTTLLGRDVNYMPASIPQARAEMLAKGWEPELANAKIELWGSMDSGLLDYVTLDLQDLLGRPPTSFAEFILDHRDFFEHGYSVPGHQFGLDEIGASAP